MARSPHYRGNNKGGYGNPPVDHQFKGKPGPGRPKGSTSLDGSLRKVFRKKIVRVSKDGKRSKVDAPEALAERALELGLKGSLPANIEARKLAEKYGHQDQQVEMDLSKLTHAELYMYGYLASRLHGIEADDPKARRIFAQIDAILKEEGQRESEQYWDTMRRPAVTSRLPCSVEEMEDDVGDE